jgi:predicted transglutaminase-like cysteine proteinase
VKSTLFATLITFAMLAPAAAEQRQVPTNVTSAGVPAASAKPGAEAQWSQLAAYINTLPASHRAGHVNLMLNGLRYAADAQTTGQEDRWDTPLEFIGRGVGDCEDFAIAKYFMLLEAGVAPELVRLAFVFYTGDAKLLGAAAGPKRTHVVVLQYQHIGDRNPLVLDAVPQIVPLSEREDLHLVFEFGADGNHTAAVSESVVSSRAIGRMMAKWGEVLARMRSEGGREADMVALGNRVPPQQVAQSAGAVRSR